MSKDAAKAASAAVASGWFLPHLSVEARGAAAMMASTAFFVVNDVLMKLVSTSLPTGEMMAIRGVFATLVVLTVAAAQGALASMRLAWQPLVLARAGLDGFTGFLVITALSRMPIADVTAILQTVPLIGTALSVLLLGERVRWRRWTAIAVGFIGMLLVVRPAAEGFNLFGLVALVSAFSIAFRDIVTHRVDPGIPSILVTLTTSIVVLLAASMLSTVETWRLPSGQDLAMLAAAAVAVSAGNLMIVVAFRVAEVSAVQPFRYSVILWALLAGLLVWGDIPDPIAFLGILLIIGSGLYAFRRQAQLRSRAA